MDTGEHMGFQEADPGQLQVRQVYNSVHACCTISPALFCALGGGFTPGSALRTFFWLYSGDHIGVLGIEAGFTVCKASLTVLSLQPPLNFLFVLGPRLCCSVITPGSAQGTK